MKKKKKVINVHDPKYRREERIDRLMKSKRRTRKEAEEMVDTVIRTKEN